MNSIEIQPVIHNEMFVTNIVMTDYNVDKPLIFSITARRNDGLMEIKNFIYPESGVEYNENVNVVFFGMAESHKAQILGVFINGNIVMNYYTGIGDLDIQARYNDSITQISRKKKLKKPELDLQVIPSYDPKILIVADSSEWGASEDRPTVIEILVPGFKEPVVFYFKQYAVNHYTSATLGLNCIDNCNPVYQDLPDGVYEITLKASPSTYSIKKRYLKTDLAQLEIDKLYIKASMCEHRDNDLMEKIHDVNFMLSAAEASTRMGNVMDAHKLFDNAIKIIEQAQDCVKCK